MKEFEFVVSAMDAFIVDQLVSVICTENYEEESYVGGFQKIFDDFRTLHEEYQKNREKLDSPGDQTSYTEQIRAWESRRNDVRKSFLEYIKEDNPGHDIFTFVRTYEEKMKAQDITSIEMRVLLYPYMIRKMRELEADC